MSGFGDYGDYDYFGDYDDYDEYDSPRFQHGYRCRPMSSINKEELEKGDKIIMPPSALDRLGQYEIDYPMLFKLKNPSCGKVTHCGVLEFTAEEGEILLPSWMMEGMLVEEDDFVLVENVSLPKGTYVKLQPHTKDFLDISNPRAVLEMSLRNYSCLTIGDTIVIHYNDKKFLVDILETKPSNAVCIIETDCEADFAPPLDYVEPPKPESTTQIKPKQQAEESERTTMKPVAFTGSSRRLDGKPSAKQVEPVSVPAINQKSEGSSSNSTKLVFGSNGKQKSSSETTQDPVRKEEKQFIPFSGRKYLLNG